MPPTMQVDVPAAAAPTSVPSLIQSLQEIRRMVKVFAVAYGAGLVVAVAVSALVVTVALDWLLNLPTPLRIVLVLAGLGALAYVAYDRVFRPLTSRLSINDVAGRLE